MTYSDFKQTVLAFLKDKLHPSTRITIQPFLKNNHVVLDGLVILEENANISPTIYLNPFYQKLQNGIPLSHILLDILQCYHRYKPDRNMELPLFTDYRIVAPNIVYRLIHYEQNRDLLSDLPHQRFLDLALIYYYLIPSASIGNAAVRIHNHHLRLWHISKEELFATARQNTPKLLPSVSLSMNTIFERYQKDCPSFCPDTPDTDSPLFLLSNTTRLYGAAVMLYPKLLEDFAHSAADDIFLIPSSIHEVLLFPAGLCGRSMADALNKMVQEVNLTHLSKEDVLSDHVYFYSRSDRAIQVLS